MTNTANNNINNKNKRQRSHRGMNCPTFGKAVRTLQ